MSRYRIFLDSFDVGLVDLPKALQSSDYAVLRVIAEAGRFSCFEASDNPRLANTVTRLLNGGPGFPPMIRDVGGAYPWVEVELTDDGRKAMAQGATPPVGRGRRPYRHVLPTPTPSTTGHTQEES